MMWLSSCNLISFVLVLFFWNNAHTVLFRFNVSLFILIYSIYSIHVILDTLLQIYKVPMCFVEGGIISKQNA